VGILNWDFEWGFCMGIINAYYQMASLNGDFKWGILNGDSKWGA